jgi:hypothetical protein
MGGTGSWGQWVGNALIAFDPSGARRSRVLLSAGEAGTEPSTTDVPLRRQTLRRQTALDHRFESGLMRPGVHSRTESLSDAA